MAAPAAGRKPPRPADDGDFRQGLNHENYQTNPNANFDFTQQIRPDSLCVDTCRMEKRTQMVWSSHVGQASRLSPSSEHECVSFGVPPSGGSGVVCGAPGTARYGSGTALVRLENENRPVFIGLARRYGSRGVKYTPSPLPAAERHPGADAEPTRDARPEVSFPGFHIAAAMRSPTSRVP